MSMNFSFDIFRNTVSGGGAPRPEPEAPFRILVVGDFSGRGNRGQIEALDARTPSKVDIDNFETLMAAWKTRLGLRAGHEGAFGVGFQELEHFHPEQIFRRVELFTALRELRTRLTNPSTSAAAAAEVRAWANAKPASTVEPKPMEAAATPRSEFEALLGGKVGAAPAAAAGHVEALIRELIRPHIVPSSAPDLHELVALVDETIAAQMRSVLHDPSFQLLEANWRNLHMLITGLETGEELQVFVLDADRAELEHDVFSNGARGLHALLTERPRSTPGGHPWSVICLLERFGGASTDAQLLGGLAVCVHASGAILLAGAHDRLAGADALARTPRPENWTTTLAPDDAAAWQLVRSLGEASSVGLALPRVLGRLPYGARTEPVDAFAFEELEGAGTHENLLWTNPAAHCTLVLGRGFTDAGWSLDPQAGGDVDGLPVYVPGSGPDRSAVPCAEAWLTDAASQTLLERGLIPVLSVQHRDAVRIPRLCAINGRALQASWA